MMLYRRGEVWWYKFRFAGQVFRESAKTSTKELARRAERKRRTLLEETYHGIAVERRVPKLFAVAADEWLEVKKGTLAAKSHGVERNSLAHLKPVFGQRLLTDINAASIARYVGHRRGEGAADKSIKLEIGTLRGILRRARLWGALADDDLLHSAVTRLLEGGVSFPIVASLLGWSPSTTTKMAKRYGHIGSAAHREAVAALDPSTNQRQGGTKEGTLPSEPKVAIAVSA